MSLSRIARSFVVCERRAENCAKGSIGMRLRLRQTDAQPRHLGVSMHRERGSLARYSNSTSYLPSPIARSVTYIMACLRSQYGLSLRSFRGIDTLFALSLPPS